MNFDFLDVQTIAAIIFVILMCIFLIIKRKELATEKIFFPLLYILMYRTKLGLKLMNKIANKFRRSIVWLGYFGVVVGFVGMAVIVFFLVKNLYFLITVPSAAPSVGLVLPFKVKGAFFVPFFYWIICIFIIATVHEFSHGIVARRYGMKIKSSGLAFMAILLPVIPAAFVEPDEKEMVKKPKRQQLSMFAAGPFSNIVLAGIVLLVSLFIFTPIINNMVDVKGVNVVGFTDTNASYPAEIAGMKPGEVITQMDSTKIETMENFTYVLDTKKPGDKVIVATNASRYTVVLSSSPENASKPYMGILVSQYTEVKPGFEQRFGTFTPAAILWIFGLLYWLFVLSLGIGLFNLVPLGPVDGGRMLLTSLESVCKDKKRREDKKKAAFWWKVISIFFLILVLANLAFAFIR